MAARQAPEFSREDLFAALDELRFMLLVHEASVRATSVGQFEWDQRNDCLGYCSKDYAQLFGHRHVNINRAQDSWEKFITQIHADDRERYVAACEHRQGRNSVTCDYRIVLPNGGTRHVQETGIYTDPGARARRGNYGIVRDVSLQKLVESSLEDDEVNIRDIAGFGMLGGFLYDEIHEKFLFVDLPLTELYGVDERYMLEHIRSHDDDFEFVHRDDRTLLDRVYEDFEMGDIWEAEYRIVRADGEIRWVREMGKSYLVENGVDKQTIGVVLDISDRKTGEIELMKIRENLENEVEERTSKLKRAVRLLKSEVRERKKIAARLKHLANHDPLTGLPGLRLGMDRLAQVLAAADRSRETCAVMFLDLDKFKRVNDGHGHPCGDAVLKRVARRFRRVIRKADTVARIGGDEFMVILSRLPETGIVDQVARKLITEASRAVRIGSDEFRVGLSIGIALYPAEGFDAEALIRAADKAMYRVKQNGGNDFMYA